MVTLHPFVGYYKDEDILKHVNFVSISECNIHDSVSVHLFITQFLSHIKEKLPMINKIIYYSGGGCAAQYKNCKNFLNLCHHNEDFGMDAEWNFFATSHGKGPCDGLGGTVKHLAAKARLQCCAERRNTEQKLTAEERTIQILFKEKHYSEIGKMIRSKWEYRKHRRDKMKPL